MRRLGTRLRTVDLELLVQNGTVLTVYYGGMCMDQVDGT